MRNIPSDGLSSALCRILLRGMGCCGADPCTGGEFEFEPMLGGCRKPGNCVKVHSTATDFGIHPIIIQNIDFPRGWQEPTRGLYARRHVNFSLEFQTNVHLRHVSYRSATHSNGHASFPPKPGSHPGSWKFSANHVFLPGGTPKPARPTGKPLRAAALKLATAVWKKCGMTGLAGPGQPPAAAAAAYSCSGGGRPPFSKTIL